MHHRPNTSLLLQLMDHKILQLLVLAATRFQLLGVELVDREEFRLLRAELGLIMLQNHRRIAGREVHHRHLVRGIEMIHVLSMHVLSRDKLGRHWQRGPERH